MNRILSLGPEEMCACKPVSGKPGRLDCFAFCREKKGFPGTAVEIRQK